MDESEAVRWIVRFERPNYAAMASLDRAGRFAALRAHSAAVREAFEAWIAAQGLDGQVTGVTRLTYVSMTFLTCTPAVAARLAQAPGVAGIGPDVEIEVSLDIP